MKRSVNLITIKNIIMITPTWDMTVGGTSKVVYNLVHEIRNIYPNCLIHIITSDHNIDADSDVSYLGNNLISKLIGIFILLLRFRPEVIHCHGRVHYLLISYIYKILFDNNAKLIYSFYTQPTFRYFLPQAAAPLKNTISEAIKSKISFFVLNKADHIVANSNSLADNINKSFDFKLMNPIKMIPSGVETPHISENNARDFSKLYSLQDAYPIFLTVGVFQWDWKVAGILILLKAFQEVIGIFPSARLVLVGDGQYRNLIEDNIEQLNIQKYVIMTGNLSNTFIPLGACDIYCHMALNESCSISILEAMICGKPIIAASAGGNPDLIKNDETGILVDPDKDMLKNVMLDLGNNRELAAKLGHAAEIFAKENYNWNVITNKYLQLYMN